jgi:hypothetical protein
MPRELHPIAAFGGLTTRPPRPSGGCSYLYSPRRRMTVYITRATSRRQRQHGSRVTMTRHGVWACSKRLSSILNTSNPTAALGWIKLQPKMCSSSLRSSVELSNEICAPQVGLGHQSRDGIVVRQHRGVCQPQAGLVDRCEQRGRDGGGGSWWGEQAGSSITCECKEGSAGRELVTLLEHPGTAAAVCSPLPAHLWEGSTRVRHNAREVCRPRLEQRP